MTGPEHYRRAQECLAELDEGEDNTEWLLCAQVHATLALAAATALSYGLPPADWHAWNAAAATTDGAP